MANPGSIAISVVDDRIYLIGLDADDDEALLGYNEFGALQFAAKFSDEDAAFGEASGLFIPEAGKVWVAIKGGGGSPSTAGQIWEYDSDGVFVSVIADDLNDGHTILSPRQFTKIGDILYFLGLTTGDVFNDGIYRHRISTNAPLTPLIASTGGTSWDLKRTADGIKLLQGLDSAGGRLVRTDGTIEQTYNSIGGLSVFGIAPDPDGVTFWVSDNDDNIIRRLALSDGSLVDSFSEGAGAGSDYILASPLDIDPPDADGFWIDDVQRDILQSWSISEQLNERGTMRFGVKSMDGSYRPGLREQIDFHWASQHFFAGFIHHTEEGGLGGYGVVPIVTQCGATDFNALPDRRQLAITLPAGTLKSMLELLEPYLTDYGVTLDPAQVDGPTLVELTFTLGPLTSVLNKLSLTSEYAWNIDYDKVLSMFAPGTEAAPFDIEDDDARVVGDVRVSPTTVDYANRIIVLAGTGTQDVSDPVGVGDGVEDTFELNYNVASLYGYVTNNVTNETLRVVGDPDAATWEYDPATNSITRLTGAPGVGDAITIPYTAQFPFEVIAEDVPAQEGGANLYERVYTHPEVFDAVTAQALADGYLVRSLVQPREIRYRTRLHGLHPGMQQQIQVTTRNVDGPCLITAVDISPEGSALYNYDITAVEGLTIVPSYQEAWRTLAGVSGN